MALPSKEYFPDSERLMPTDFLSVKAFLDKDEIDFVQTYYIPLNKYIKALEVLELAEKHIVTLEEKILLLGKETTRSQQ